MFGRYFCLKSKKLFHIVRKALKVNGCKCSVREQAYLLDLEISCNVEKLVVLNF